MVVLVGGGSRSGKSRFALEYARRFPRPRVFIGTAELLDEEMKTRAEAHRIERGEEFLTVEEPLNLAEAVVNAPRGAPVVIDCLTLWTSNLMMAGRDVLREAPSLLLSAEERDGSVILVTNEVGCGIVPDNELSRRFRDATGWLNQYVASRAAEVHLLMFGCQLRLK